MKAALHVYLAANKSVALKKTSEAFQNGGDRP